MNPKLVAKKKVLSRTMKFFYLSVFFGTIFLVVHGFQEYKNIFENPKVIIGVIYDMNLYSSGTGNYRWNVYYKYTINGKIYKSQLKDQSAFSKNYSINDTLFVYYNDFDPKNSLAYKTPINIKIKPNLLDFMLRDSQSGYLLDLVILVIMVYTIPVLIDFLFVVIVGLFLRFFNASKSKLFIRKGLNRIKNKTLIRIGNFIDKW